MKNLGVMAHAVNHNAGVDRTAGSAYFMSSRTSRDPDLNNRVDVKTTPKVAFWPTHLCMYAISVSLAKSFSFLLFKQDWLTTNEVKW